MGDQVCSLLGLDGFIRKEVDGKIGKLDEPCGKVNRQAEQKQAQRQPRV